MVWKRELKIGDQTELGSVLALSLNLVFLLSILYPQVCHSTVTFVKLRNPLQPCLGVPYEDAALCQPRPRPPAGFLGVMGSSLLWFAGRGQLLAGGPYGPLRASMTAGFPTASKS